MGRKTVAERYKALKSSRDPYMTRARNAAKLTIPTLIPEEGSNKNTVFEKPYQSLGARGVNHLASKLRLLLLPPNNPFWSFRPNKILLNQEMEMMRMLGQEQEAEALKTDLETNLAQLENTLLQNIESTQDGAVLNEAFKHLLVAGNVLLVDTKTGLKYYPLSRYVVNRDYSGNVLEVITEEKVSRLVLGDLIDEIKQGGGEAKDDELTLYTYLKRTQDNRWEIYQEIDGVVIRQTKGSYPLDRCPFISLRYTRIDGENYGRGFVEDLYADLWTLNQLSKAITEGSLAAAKLVFFVDPNSYTDSDELANAENCAIIDGNASDVSTLQAAKTYDFATAKEEIHRLNRELSLMFLLTTGIQRSGDRVTATEISLMAEELEKGMGGFYSILSKEFQPQYLKLKFHNLRKKYPKLPNILEDDRIEIQITTGLEALGKTNDLRKMEQYFTLLGQVAQLPFVNINEVEKRIAAAQNFDSKGLIKDPQQLQAEQQQAQLMQLAEKGLPNGINQLGQLVQQQTENGNGNK